MAETADIYFLSVLEAGSLRSSVASLVSFEAFSLGLRITIFIVYMSFALYVTTFLIQFSSVQFSRSAMSDSL